MSSAGCAGTNWCTLEVSVDSFSVGNAQDGNLFFPRIYGINGAVGGNTEAVVLLAFEFFTLGREGVGREVF